MSQTAKVYLAVMPSGQIEFSVESDRGGEVLSASYLTERDARALHSQLGSVLGQIDGVLPNLIVFAYLLQRDCFQTQGIAFAAVSSRENMLSQRAPRR